MRALFNIYTQQTYSVYSAKANFDFYSCCVFQVELLSFLHRRMYEQAPNSRNVASDSLLTIEHVQDIWSESNEWIVLAGCLVKKVLFDVVDIGEVCTREPLAPNCGPLKCTGAAASTACISSRYEDMLFGKQRWEQAEVCSCRKKRGFFNWKRREVGMSDEYKLF